VSGIDPESHWLEAGITGLARPRRWDALVTYESPGADGDEAELIVLDDERILIDSSPDGFDPARLGRAFEGSIAPPFRAVARYRSGIWVAGAVAIEVEELVPDPGGDELELTWNGSELSLTVDDLPADPARAAAFERLAAERLDGAYAARARRLSGDSWEVSILAL
jgi:hypothetical protein